MTNSTSLLIEGIEPDDVDVNLLVGIMDTVEEKGYSLAGISISPVTHEDSCDSGQEI